MKSRWKTILARICWTLSALLAVLGVVFTASLIRHYGEAAGAVNLAMQAGLIWVPPAFLCAIAAFLLSRSEKRSIKEEA